MLALHVTNTKNLESIKKNGLKCTDASVHPVAKNFECATFLYPLDGIDYTLKFTPQNAKMRGETLADTSFVIVDVPNCVVGDLHLEDQEDAYKSNTTTLKNYITGRERRRFKEPEIVCRGTIDKEDILGSMSFGEVDVLYNTCKTSGEYIHKCMELGISKILKK